MRSSTNIMSTGFTSVERTFIDLYRLTLPSSAVYYFTGHDMDVASHASVGGTAWQAIPIKRNVAKFDSGLRVDDMELQIANVGVVVASVETPLSQLAMRGTLDGAEVTIYQTDVSNIASAGLFMHSDWTVQGVTADRATVKLKLESQMARLNALTPRRTWQEQCNWPLFSQWCTLSRTNYTLYGTVVGSVTTSNLIQFAVTSRGTSVPSTVPGSWFDLGQVVFTSGDANGLRRTVRVQSESIPPGSQGSVALLVELPFVPASGTTFTAVPGCNKTLTHCVSKYNNAVNYGGFPYIPKPEVPLGG